MGKTLNIESMLCGSCVFAARYSHEDQLIVIEFNAEKMVNRGALSPWFEGEHQRLLDGIKAKVDECIRKAYVNLESR